MSARYIIEESLAGFRRNRMSMSITIFTVGIALLLLGVFALITQNFSQLVDSIKDRVELEVFLKDSDQGTAHSRIGAQIRKIQGVAEVSYISKEQAVSIFEKEIGEQFWDILDYNPLPASYRVKVMPNSHTPEIISALAGTIRAIPGVESVVYRKQFLTLIDRRARVFQTATLFIGLVLGLSAMILVANTIRLTIYAKRDMITTMKLVGATPMFIRLPFLLEGGLQGMIGGVLASLLIGTLFSFFLQPISEDLLIHIEVTPLFYGALVLTGLFLGFIGSALSIGRFLREALAVPH